MDGPPRSIYRPRGLPAWTLNQTAVGSGRFTAADGRADTTEIGDLVLIPPGGFNDYGNGSAGGRWAHRWCVFLPPVGWEALLDWPAWLPGHGRVRPGSEVTVRVAYLFDQLIAIAHGPLRSEELLLAHLAVILRWVEASLASGPTGRDQDLARAQARALEALDHDWSVAEMAAVAGCSPSRFAHRFRAAVGQPPQAWLERRRCARAAEMLLMTSLTVAEVGRLVGYHDPAYFSRVFRRNLGIAPRTYRAGSNLSGWHRPSSPGVRVRPD